MPIEDQAELGIHCWLTPYVQLKQDTDWKTNVLSPKTPDNNPRFIVDIFPLLWKYLVAVSLQ